MNASSKSMSSGAADTEVTAELPVLDVNAYEARNGHDPLASTDTWSAPTMNTALMPHLANLPPDPPEPPLSALVSQKLEMELRALASNLSELETRLAAKGERLTIIEAELAESRIAGQGAATRAATLSEELAASRQSFDRASAEIDSLQMRTLEQDEALRIITERENALRKSATETEAELRQHAAAREAELTQAAAAREGQLTKSFTELEAKLRKSASESESDLKRVAAEREAKISKDAAVTEAKLRKSTSETEKELRRSAAETEKQLRESAAARESELKQTLDRRESEISTTLAADSIRNAAVLKMHESALNVAQQQVVQLQAQTVANHESLQSMEGRRGIFDSMLRALDMQIVGRDQDQSRLTQDLARSTARTQELNHELESRSQRVGQLEAEVAALNTKLEARTGELGSVTRSSEEQNRALEALRQESAANAARVGQLDGHLLEANKAHTEALEAANTTHAELRAINATLDGKVGAQDAELAAMRKESAEHLAAVQQVTAEHADRVAQLGERDAQIAALTEQVAAQAQTIQSDGEKLHSIEERIATAENDVRVSEESIHRLESEVRARTARVEELTKLNTQMQTQITDAKRWLDERDALMQRLETEAAHSAALVDNIQRSIRQLTPGATGTNEVVREAGARLLIRSQDGHEVVHVLGRKTTIGRTPDNDMQINASFISRHHAVLLVTNGNTVIEDLNSTNGVYVNGKRVTREALNDGDLVMVGKARFRFAVRPAPVRASADASA